ncbi:MAG TPA: alpha/beta fold hydrolase [Allosphingosinicella sp.]
MKLSRVIEDRERADAACAFEVRLPPSLARFGETARFSLCGPDDAPLVVVLGGISANLFPCIDDAGEPGWWPGLAGKGRGVCSDKFRILGVDFIADPRGRRAPSPRDQAAAIVAALDQIGVGQAHAIVGASYGGMIALAMAEHFPDRVERIAVISADARPHPAATAIRALQRRIVALGLAQGGAAEALSIARGLAMTSYRTSEEFDVRFAGGIRGDDVLGASGPGDYLRARGDAFGAVMSPERFLSLSASIDRHDVDPAKIAHKVLLIGATSDQLVPPAQIQALADGLAGPVELHLLDCLYGHDLFLKEAAAVSALVGPFFEARS